jgi:hypothetical protein
MRKALVIVSAAALITFAAVEIVAASAKSVAVIRFHYAAPISQIHVAVPAGTRGFSTDLLPQ